jgi:hypothetical protein
MGCGSSDNPTEPNDAGAGEPTPDLGVEEDMEPPEDPPNIGDPCDPAQGQGEDELNPACEGPARCLDYGNDTDGMCVVFSCREDNIQTRSNEDSCRLDYGNEYVCIDINANDDTNLADNVCVKKCVPSDNSNPCEDPFACTPISRRFNFKDTVCFDLGCQTGADCPVSITNDTTCTGDADCLGATDFCVLANDTNGDGTADIGACSEAGSCNSANGLCEMHTMGNLASRIGDPCQADIDCPNGGTCINQTAFDDANGIIFQTPRNGYCSMFGCKYDDATGATCPAGSACNTTFFAGGCMDLCDPEAPMDCRDDLDSDGDPTGNGTPCNVAMGITTNCDWYADYDCYDWGGFTWTVDSTPVVDGSDGRICDYISSIQRDCSVFASFGCAALAPTGNPVGMDCRFPRTGLPAGGGADDAGRCLDTTTSGDLCPVSWDLNGNCIP